MAGSSDSAMQLEPDSEDSAPGRNTGPSDSGCWPSLAASRRDTLWHGYAACELVVAVVARAAQASLFRVYDMSQLP